MADWDLPDIDSAYATDFLDYLLARDFDAISLGYGTITNPQEGMMRYVRASNKFQEYLSGVWTDKALSLAGGGTGAATAAGARTALGLGTIAIQDANNVSISGGSISALSSLGVNGNTTLVGDLTVGGVLKTGSGVVQLTHANGKIQAISSTYFQSLDGSALTTLNGSNISSGTVAAARLGSGSSITTKYLRGDNTWQTLNMVVSIQRANIDVSVSGVSFSDVALSTPITDGNRVHISFVGAMTEGVTLSFATTTSLRVNHGTSTFTMKGTFSLTEY